MFDLGLCLITSILPLTDSDQLGFRLTQLDLDHANSTLPWFEPT